MKKSGTGKSSSRIGEGPILTLERVERQQSGVYQCTADNNVGEAATVDMRLDVLCKFFLLLTPMKTVNYFSGNHKSLSSLSSSSYAAVVGCI